MLFELSIVSQRADSIDKMEQNANEDQEKKRKYKCGYHKRQEKLHADLRKDAAGSNNFTSFFQSLSASSSTTTETALSVDSPNNDQDSEGKGRFNYSINLPYLPANLLFPFYFILLYSLLFLHRMLFLWYTQHDHCQ